MRPFATVIAICMLVCAGAANAQIKGYCPFLAFCDAQRGDCRGSCSALALVREWSTRQAWRQSCSDSCEAQYNSCAARLYPRCFDRENWH
jgi:hypothetical protein